MGDEERKRAEALIAKIAQSPDEASVKELATIGTEALPAMRKAAQDHELGESSRDALLQVVALMATEDPDPLLARIDDAGNYKEAVVWALGFADPARVTRPLIRLLHDPDDGVREAAARSLVRLRTAEAAEALIPALDDQSRGVKFVAVQALHDDTFFRLPEAVPRLERLISDRHLKDEETEMVRHAKEVLAAMEH